MWAGVKLPGGQYRKREQLAEAHATLRRIAAGEISSRQLADERRAADSPRERRRTGHRHGISPARRRVGPRSAA